MWTTYKSSHQSRYEDVSIPLRGFHVDNWVKKHRKEIEESFNPLAGIPCGQRRNYNDHQPDTSFNPLAGIPCGQPLATIITSMFFEFQSPCGDSMWTTCVMMKERVISYVFQSPCGDSMWTTIFIYITTKEDWFQSPCGDSMWTTMTCRRINPCTCFNPLAGIPCGQQRMGLVCP